MVFCSISNCGNSSKTCNLSSKGITFHMFPKDPDIKDKWISATGKRNWFPTNNSRICSVHFTSEQFCSSTKRRTLFKSAVPTVDVWQLFTVTDDLQPTVTPSTSSSTRKIREIVDPTESPLLAALLSDSGQADTPRKKNLRSELIRSRGIIADQRLRIKRLQTKVRRYRKTILKLRDITKKLEDERLRLILITGDQGQDVSE